MKSYVVPLVISLSVVACASSPKMVTSKTEPQPPVHESPAETAKTGSIDNSAVAAVDLTRLVQQLKGESDYFDFNKAIVKPEFRNIIKQQAAFLRSHTNDIVTLEGNCDERGSDKYNLALGERRAQAVSLELKQLGVPARQIEVVSYGKERPRSTCHNESCWKDDRRVDFDHHMNG